MAGKHPENKRARDQLSSSETDDMAAPLRDIHESLSFMKQQLRKLDLLEKLRDEVAELKHSVEFNNALIETLKADNASVRVEVNELKRQTTELRAEKVQMANVILDLNAEA
ncbi:hypothetical protein AAFF_G00021970 [Aldrovandia affinis]|uniref:Uncharacterized protein n=1 Tax=Aldrovandia affinis TaxID=143900 RepID=A0AAD7S517_9TELE|nr:hypothetical protein AAFF_G00021970 [Aldrovandia affinis]